MADYISREAAIDAIKTWGLIDGLSEGQAIEILADEEKLPSAQPERKKGKWVDVQFRTMPLNRISKAKKCSVCGKTKDKYVVWNFCPSCGADMRGEEND